MRVSFPEDEARFKWLPLLLNAYAIIDEGIEQAIKQGEAERGQRPACRKGCDSCCTGLGDIPVYPLELVGIYWYATEKTVPPLRGRIFESLKSHKEGSPCPFGLDSSCSIYPMRPIACRQFNVYGAQCAPGEDPYYTRAKDVMTPISDFTERAFYEMMPFYGITENEDRKEAVSLGLIHSRVRVIQRVGWPELARVMEEFDRKRPPC